MPKAYASRFDNIPRMRILVSRCLLYGSFSAHSRAVMQKSVLRRAGSRYSFASLLLQNCAQKDLITTIESLILTVASLMSLRTAKIRHPGGINQCAAIVLRTHHLNCYLLASVLTAQKI